MHLTVIIIGLGSAAFHATLQFMRATRPDPTQPAPPAVSPPLPPPSACPSLPHPGHALTAASLRTPSARSRATKRP